MRHIVGAALILAAMGVVLGGPNASADETSQAASILSPGRTFSEQSGESLYMNVCQGCHMRDGKGATGAGNYPSLAASAGVAAGSYVAAVIVRGQRAMPPVGRRMSDDQVAAVANYVRTHFGNHYHDAVTAADVKALRR